MSEFNGLPELVRRSRLETTIEQDRTVHTGSRGRRGIASEEVWVRERIIGHGGYGQVWVERQLDSPERSTPGLRAVKCIHASAKPRDYIRELEALAKFSSDPGKYAKFFVEFHGWYESPGWLHVAMEYCDHGDLNHYLRKFKTLSEKETQEVTLQVLRGLSLMHEAGFAHRDVKPANILIKSAPPGDWWVKLCDLGLSKKAEIVTSSTNGRGTLDFMPPESLGLNGEKPNDASSFSRDIWSLGETVHQVLTGHRTFESIGKLMGYVNGSVEFPQMALIEARVSESGLGFVRSLMAPIPSQRLSARQALEQPWMNFGEQAKLGATNGPSQAQSNLEQFGSGESDETSQVSGHLTRPQRHKSKMLQALMAARERSLAHERFEKHHWSQTSYDSTAPGN